MYTNFWAEGQPRCEPRTESYRSSCPGCL